MVEEVKTPIQQKRDNQRDIYWQSVCRYDMDEMQGVQSKLNKFLEVQKKDWIKIREKRRVGAQHRVEQAKALAERISNLTSEPNDDHQTAIEELRKELQTEENKKGLIPCELSTFVENGRVDIDKLLPVLGKV